ncbi:MAG: hypothetical protein HY687_03605 [Chloroflexi bacterium]|nr:hypothetical protein [Chloroflexota bacterium]
MDCSACVYFADGDRCALHGEAREGLAFFQCLDFVDGNNQYLPNPTGCCGILNYPLLQEAPAPEPK